MKKEENNQMMIDLVLTLSYVEFYDVKECAIKKKMWDKLVQIHGGDKNVLRAKAESLRGKFDGMIMKGETIAQYYGQIKL